MPLTKLQLAAYNTLFSQLAEEGNHPLFAALIDDLVETIDELDSQIVETPPTKATLVPFLSSPLSNPEPLPSRKADSDLEIICKVARYGNGVTTILARGYGTVVDYSCSVGMSLTAIKETILGMIEKHSKGETVELQFSSRGFMVGLIEELESLPSVKLVRGISMDAWDQIKDAQAKSGHIEPTELSPVIQAIREHVRETMGIDTADQKPAVDSTPPLELFCGCGGDFGISVVMAVRGKSVIDFTFINKATDEDLQNALDALLQRNFEDGDPDYRLDTYVTGNSSQVESLGQWVAPHITLCLADTRRLPDWMESASINIRDNARIALGLEANREREEATEVPISPVSDHELTQLREFQGAFSQVFSDHPLQSEEAIFKPLLFNADVNGVLDLGKHLKETVIPAYTLSKSEYESYAAMARKVAAVEERRQEIVTALEKLNVWFGTKNLDSLGDIAEAIDEFSRFEVVTTSNLDLLATPLTQALITIPEAPVSEQVQCLAPRPCVCPVCTPIPAKPQPLSSKLTDRPGSEGSQAVVSKSGCSCGPLELCAMQSVPVSKTDIAAVTPGPTKDSGPTQSIIPKTPATKASKKAVVAPEPPAPKKEGLLSDEFVSRMRDPFLKQNALLEFHHSTGIDEYVTTAEYDVPAEVAASVFRMLGADERPKKVAENLGLHAEVVEQLSKMFSSNVNFILQGTTDGDKTYVERMVASRITVQKQTRKL